MNFKKKILSKSNSFNFYKTEHKKYKNRYESTLNDNSKLKKENKRLKKENKKLKEDLSHISNIRRLESIAGSFCNKKFYNYSFHDDFPLKFAEFLKNLPDESKNDAIHIYLRANAAYLLNNDTLFTEEELKLQDEYIKFSNENVSGNEICGFKFTDNSFNKHCFMNNFSDEDKEYMKNKDIIDAGAYIGDSSLAFSKLTNSNIYAFEPFEESFNKLIDNININDVNNIVAVQASLSDKIGEEKLYLSGDNVQGITSDESVRRYDKTFDIQTITIDQYVQNHDLNVGFIKVDVEGGEQKLLNGAIETIKTQKPILFLSIYHKPNDFFEIKPWIEKLGVGYSFKISKERPWTFLADTVLECRPY